MAINRMIGLLNSRSESGAASNDAMPLLTVIVAVYNGEATLQQCIDSIARQTYPNKELVIIDGGSKDGTVELLEENRNKISYWISEPDNGIYNAWNKGLAHAQGEWVCFLGADDFFWDATVLERMAARLASLPASIRVAYGQIMQVGTGGEAPRPKGEPWQQVKERFKQCMCIPHVGTMHRRNLFEQRGKFDESFRIAGDYELLLRELITGDAVFIPEIVTVAQRIGGISTDAVNYMNMMRETRRAQRMHGLFLSQSYFLKEIAKEHLRRLLWNVLGERLARKLLDMRRRSKGLPPYWTSK